MNHTHIRKRGILDAFIKMNAIFRAFPDLLLFIDADGQVFDTVAGEASDYFPEPDQLLGRSMRHILPPEVGIEFDHALQEIKITGQGVSIEFRLPILQKDCWFEARLIPLGKTNAIAIVRDVSERVRGIEHIHSQLQRLSSLYSFDADNTATFDLKQALSVILQQMINDLGVDAADVLVLNPDTRMLEFAAGQGFSKSKSLQLPVMVGQGSAGLAALERRTISMPDLEEESADALFPSEVLRHKFANYYAVPLIAKGQVRGVLEIYHNSLLRPEDEWLDSLATTASQTAVVIDCACLFQDLRQIDTDLNHAYDSTIETWAQMLKISNPESGAYAFRVVELTMKLARFMGIAEHELNNFRRGALLHDIGKLGISESILNTPGPLDDTAWKIMKSHPQLAYQLLSSVNYLAHALDIPHYHHERWDGSGYPDGLRREQIPFPARLFAVVDVYDAMTSSRPYRPAFSHLNVLDYIQQNTGILFDPDVVKAFMQMMGN